MRLFFLLLLATLLPWWCPKPAAAAPATPALLGALGLNIVPSARMEPTGTVRAGLTTLDPYLHATISAQLAAPLNVTLRQSAEISGLTAPAERLYPGIDVRLRLLRETAYRPEVTLGLQSAAGHKRMAGEYIAASKRYHDFDLTAGIGWGRLGSAGHISNPLKLLGHFGKNRALDGQMPSGPEQWFTGQQAGFFAGIAYQTPLDGLALKADWGADRYLAEQAAFDYNAPAPWSVGLSYSPADWLQLGLALAGGEKLLGSLHIKAPAGRWPGRGYKVLSAPEQVPMRPYRTGLALPDRMAHSAQRERITLYEPAVNGPHASARLETAPYESLPRQLGRAAKHISNHAGEYVEDIQITPVRYGLTGPKISLIRRDLERALTNGQGSPEEIWRRTRFEQGPAPEPARQRGLWQQLHDNIARPGAKHLHLVLDQRISLSEEDRGLLYRTGLLLEEERKITRHFMAGAALRLDLFDNLDHLRTYRAPAYLPVRSDEDAFAAGRLGLERQFLGWMKTLRPDLHLALAGGYLEEMYAGFGGELLYRPFGKRFAIGAEAWQVFKRSPQTALNLGLNGDHLLSFHLNGWYEFPGSDLTLHVKAGRFLAADMGGSVSLTRRFRNGLELGAFVTATDAADPDPLGGIAHVYSGLSARLPLGNLKYLPQGAEIRLRTAPLGRDSGQALSSPLPLYEMTEPFSYRHATQYWTGMLIDP